MRLLETLEMLKVPGAGVSTPSKYMVTINVEADGILSRWDRAAVLSALVAI